MTWTEVRDPGMTHVLCIHGRVTVAVQVAETSQIDIVRRILPGNVKIKFNTHEGIHLLFLLRLNSLQRIEGIRIWDCSTGQFRIRASQEEVAGMSEEADAIRNHYKFSCP